MAVVINEFDCLISFHVGPIDAWFLLEVRGLVRIRGDYQPPASIRYVLGYPFNRTRPGPQFSRGGSQEGAPGWVGARALAAAWTALPGAAWWR